ncbi:MAG: adenosylcobinamide-GDP ribazoletransferase [Magnetospirillum sp.]|nr:adenosylcobinamide-GDP ribazoletransferase [Magnetospirillum sp.]
MRPSFPFHDRLGPWLDDFHVASSFLTRLPVPHPDYGEGRLARAMGVFPIVGAAVGLVSGLAFVLGHALLPALPAALLALLVATVCTGALHEDGLADFADGLGARGDRARRLEVMRDSRIGTFGVVALLLGFGLRASALAAAPSGLAGLGALAAAGALSRAAIPAVMQALPAARSDGLGAAAGTPDAGIAALAAVLALVVAVAGLGVTGAAAAAAAAALAAAAAGWVARRALGGYTGDVLGAVAQVAEAAVLLAAAGGW